MQYIKVFLAVVIFFLVMVFLCQNQVSLSKDVTLSLDLLVIPATPAVKLPFYFVVIAAFLLGAVACFAVLLWDRVRMSARLMKAGWRLRAMQDEQTEMLAQLRAVEEAPFENRAALVEKYKAIYEERKAGREKEDKKKAAAKQAAVEQAALPASAA